MGIFGVEKKYKGRKITKSFLKNRFFYEDRWGGPNDRVLDTSVFWERLIYVTDLEDPLEDEAFMLPLMNITATIKWFPPEFDRYTTYRQGLGRDAIYWGHGNVAGKLVIDYEKYNWEDGETFTSYKIFDCPTTDVFELAMDIFAADLAKKKLRMLNRKKAR